MLNKNEQNLINKIDQILTFESNLFKGRSLYHRFNENRISFGDESQIVNMGYSRWASEPENEVEEILYYDIDSSIMKQIFALVPENEGELSKWKETKVREDNQGFVKQWDNNYGDFIRLQFTDHSLYIVILYSGQY